MIGGYLICDLQFGSTGKGAIAYYLAKRDGMRVACAAYTPNAGHTAIDGALRFVHTAMPIAAAVPTVSVVLIGPGAVFDPLKLIYEASAIVQQLPGTSKHVIIHPAAVPLVHEDLAAELKFVTVGSTMKGTAAANWRRMQRDGSAVIGHLPDVQRIMQSRLEQLGWSLVVSARDYHRELHAGGGVMVEGAQGFSLSVYHGMYPYVTSQDTTPNAIASMCGLPANYGKHLQIVGSMRTFPIRVANRFDASGKQIGTSGPGYDDQRELDWEMLGIAPELTTVTKLPRRLFEYSRMQMKEAMRICTPDLVFVNFCNYVTTRADYNDPDLSHLADNQELVGIMEDVQRDGYCWARFLGWGPDNADIQDVKIEGGGL